ncbi:hypothetical protein [Hydrogenophaga sp. NFH-34]|uniref:hypothetical protein n=1 Tax=Hydrogenophaga sp. NFH-34 TaxID=2744446 RepID=UPI001F21F888|nr:hypothetical protein [Hydrogenophaga sp. NFH-34]
MPTQAEPRQNDRTKCCSLGQVAFVSVRHSHGNVQKQLQTLQDLHGNPPLQSVQPVVSSGATVISVHFDGTQNNGWFPTMRERLLSLAKTTQRLFCALLLPLLLTACASGKAFQERDYFPGGSPYYSFGIAQSKENFENLKRVQSAYGIYPDERSWADFKPGYALGTVSMVQWYFPFSIRWELKDGRQFILESIDVRPIMKEYFKNHDIKLQWQRESRPKAEMGDYNPSLAYEVKDNFVRIKWVITLNHTPPDKRSYASGNRGFWQFEEEEHLVTEIPGQPTSGIDFDQKREVGRNINREQ